MHRTIGRRNPRRARLAANLLALTVAASLAPFGAPVMAAEPGDESLVHTTEVFRTNGYGYYFGLDVAVEGDTMVVGAMGGDEARLGDCNRGLAYVYERVDALEWREVAQLTFSEPIHCHSEHIGFSVAIHGEWIAVGGPLVWVLKPDADPVDPEPVDFNSAQGVVLMYHRPAGGWQDATETLQLTEYDGNANGENGDSYWDSFGNDVAFEGDDLVVGAQNYDLGNIPDAGAVFVYREWLGEWDRAAMLTSADPSVQGQFGSSVDASEGTIAIGSAGPYYGGSDLQHGSWLFDRPVDGWSDSSDATATFNAPGSDALTVSLDGPTLVAYESHGHRVFVVERGPGGWSGALEASAQLALTGVQYDRFSRLPVGIAVEGETVAIGAPYAEEEEGETYVYHRPADGWGVPGDDTVVQPDETLHQPSPNRASGVQTGDQFGWAMDIEGDMVAVSAYLRWHMTDDTGEFNGLAGSVFMFEASTDHQAPETSFNLEPAAPHGLNGWYDEPVTLAVEATDTESGVGRIRCALVQGGTFDSYDKLPDGPCPYLNGVSVPEGEWLLFAASVDADGNRSPVISQVLKVDYTDPTPFIVLNPEQPNGPDGVWLPPLSVRVYAVEEGITGAGGWCTLDPAVPPTTWDELRAMPFCGSDFWLQAGREYTVDETHTIYVAGIDRAGNTSGVISRSFTVARAPRVTIGLSSAAPPTAGWYRGPVTVTVTGTSANGQPAPDVRCVLDPAVAPMFSDNLPASCPFTSGGAVSASGSHVVYAGSHDAGGWSPLGSATFKIDATPPTLTCQGTGPAQFVIGASEGTLTATVADAASGPNVPTASATLEADDLDTAGSFTKQVTATDVAGNVGTVACAYTVGYGIAVVSPAVGASYKAGATVPLTFRLVDANGYPVADAVATALLATRKSPCRIFVSLDDAVIRGCPTYAAATDLFSFAVKTPKSRSAVGIHDIGIEVRASNGQTVLSFVRVAFRLT